MLVKRVNELMEKSKKVVILIHRNADPDALCSAYVLRSLLDKKFPGVDLFINADGFSSLSKRIIREFNIPIESKIPILPDVVFVLDASNMTQLGELGKLYDPKRLPFIVIDHHNPPEEGVSIFDFAYVEPSFVSTSELIFLLWKEMGMIPEPELATLLMIGIVYDSRRLFYIDEVTFDVMRELIQAGGDYRKALLLLQQEMDQSEKIARLKSAQRARILKIGGWIIAYSNVSSYEASACRALIELGADLAIVLSERKNEVRISVRSTNKFYNETRINVGRDLLSPLGEIVEGEGGGHATAGGLNGKRNGKKALRIILETLRDKILKVSKD
ncbi:MAG: DHH family phosphoesterase [Candidatus Odinarchaeota archaeon]|nr:DHH family phosphoesterase [Candidatus Odinarchaeota archaeon]